MAKIFVVEDDESIRNLISVALNGFGHEVRAFELAEECLALMEKEIPQLVVLDWMLPGMDGIEALKQIRASKTLKAVPVMLLTAKDKEIDKVMGLDGGADDYMVKPFGILELSARVRNLLRRFSGEAVPDNSWEFSGLCIDEKTREVAVLGQPVNLTRKEYQLLLYLMKNQSRVVPRDELLNQVWGYDFEGETRTLDMHIRTLRQKIGAELGGLIKTVRGVGYRLTE